ncbi:MAG: hypothetical protein H0X14_03300 [Acidobacteria bacterium]|nr:hypothetical protein [Acidobacteriota bacterium]
MLNPDFQDILSVFCDEQVEFLVVGAYALAFHGFPRATGDIDLWIRRSDENAQRVWRALTRFGAPLFDLTIADLKTPDLALQIGLAPRRIDILTSIDGVSFDEAWPDRQQVEIEGFSIPVVGRAHLLQNKRAAGRPKDQGDIALLESDESNSK